MPRTYIPAYSQTSLCLAQNGKESDGNSEDEKHFGGKISQVIFCHTLNTQVPLPWEKNCSQGNFLWKDKSVQCHI